MKRLLILAALAVMLGGEVKAGFVTANWNFGTSTAVSTPTIVNGEAGFSVGGFSIGNALGTVANPISTTSASAGYTGASGQFNIGNVFRTGALNTNANGSGYFEFTVTTDNTKTAQISSFNFGARSTPTGPQAFALRSSKDGYSSNIFTASVANNSTWSLKTNASLNFALNANETVQFRLYGYSGTGSPGTGTVNGRIDDVSVGFNVSAVPEPTSGLLVGIATLAFAAFRRNRRVA
jgi:hypothetical protein